MFLKKMTNRRPCKLKYICVRYKFLFHHEKIDYHIHPLLFWCCFRYCLALNFLWQDPHCISAFRWTDSIWAMRLCLFFVLTVLLQDLQDNLLSPLSMKASIFLWYSTSKKMYKCDWWTNKNYNISPTIYWIQSFNVFDTVVGWWSFSHRSHRELETYLHCRQTSRACWNPA